MSSEGGTNMSIVLMAAVKSLNQWMDSSNSQTVIKLYLLYTFADNAVVHF